MALLVLALALLAPSGAAAQDLEPRSYSNIPIGLNFLLGGYTYTTGGLATDPSGPISGTEIVAHSAGFAYVRSFELFGSSAKLDAIGARSWVAADATVAGEQRSRSLAGFHDPRFRITWNFLGAPALSRAEFAGYRQDVIVGASLQVSAPLGQYDSTKLLNLGKNRWFVKPEIGISKAWGPLTFEIAPSITFFTRNEDFFGNTTKEQDPIYAVQGHVIYSFGQGIWAAVDAVYFTGGQSTVDGVENDDLLRTWRIGAALSLPIGPQHSVKLYGNMDLSSRSGLSSDIVGLVWQFRW